MGCYYIIIIDGLLSVSIYNYYTMVTSIHRYISPIICYLINADSDRDLSFDSHYQQHVFNQLNSEHPVRIIYPPCDVTIHARQSSSEAGHATRH